MAKPKSTTPDKSAEVTPDANVTPAGNNETPAASPAAPDATAGAPSGDPAASDEADKPKAPAAPVDPSGEYVAPPEAGDGETGENFQLEAEPVEPGYIYRSGIIYVNEACSRCEGTGTVLCRNPHCGNAHKCPDCQGTGKRRLNNTEQVLVLTLQNAKGQGRESVMTAELATAARAAVTTAQVALKKLAGFGVIERLKVGKAESSARTEWRAVELVESFEAVGAPAEAPAAE